MSEMEDQNITIKNGSGKNPDVVVRAKLSGTLLDLKKALQEQYPGNPIPERQTASLLRMPRACKGARLLYLLFRWQMSTNCCLRLLRCCVSCFIMFSHVCTRDRLDH